MGYDLSGSDSNNVDVTNDSPAKPRNRNCDDGIGDRASKRRWRCLGDFERGRKELPLAARELPVIRPCQSALRRISLESTSLSETRLETQQCRVTAIRRREFVMTAVFGHDSVLDGENAVGQAHGGKPVRDDEDGAALDNLRAYSDG